MVTILVAEDDPVDTRLISTVIRNMGHTPVRCSNGRRAFEILVDNPDFGLLITDIQMPEMSGCELVNKVRESGLNDDMPIIIYSGTIDMKEVISLLDRGAATCIKKPISPKQLAAVISRCIDASEGRLSA